MVCGKRCLVVLMMVLLLAPLIATRAAQQKESRSEDEPIKLQATLVQVPVVVSDGGGRYITDLTQRDFTIFEDGAKQTVEFFGSIDEPFTVALLIDSSGSTAEQLSYIKSAALAFIDNLRSQDKVLVMEFNDSVSVLCEATGDREVLRRAIGAIKPGEYTQVYEAVYTAVWERLGEMEGRKAVILFSDGVDSASSEISSEDTLDAIAESEDVIVYPIRYSTRADMENRIERRYAASLGAGSSSMFKKSLSESLRELDRAYRVADEYLNELANLSGGVVERADRLSDLNAAFARIAEELRHQYLLGYYPANTEKADNERRISVKVSRPGVRVRTRPGYRVAN